MECPLKDRTCTCPCVIKDVVWPFFPVYNMYTNILTNTGGNNQTPSHSPPETKILSSNIGLFGFVDLEP